MHEVRMQEAYQSEESAFLNLSRSFISVLCGYSWVILIIGFTYFNEGIPNLIKFSFFPLLALYIFGIVKSKNEYGRWLMPFSLIFLIVLIVFYPGESVSWIWLNSIVSTVLVSLGILANRKRIVVIVPIQCAVLIFNYYSYFVASEAVLKTGNVLSKGLLLLIQQCIFIFAVSFTWRKEFSAAQDRDKERVVFLGNLIARERRKILSELWQKNSIKIHAVTLNTIRSILKLSDQELRNSLPEIKQILLKEEDDRVTYFLKGNVIAAVRAGISSAKSSLNITVRAEGENIKISRRISEVITNALEELITNAQQHAGAKNLVISWSVKRESQELIFQNDIENAVIKIGITHDGKIPNIKIAPGLGTTLVIEKEILSIGGTVNMDLSNLGSQAISLSIPSTTNDFEAILDRPPKSLAMEKTRLFYAITMVGQIGVGIPFFIFLSYWWDGVKFLSAVGLLTCSLTCFLLYRKKRIDWFGSSVVAILCIVTMAATPVIAYTCTTGLPLHYILTATGYTLAMLLMWGRWQISLLGYGVWLYFANDLFRTVPWECRFIVRLPISAIIFLFPFGIFLIWISLKGFGKFSKSEKEIAQRNSLLVEEQGKLNVALENISELNNSAVAKILDVISEVESTSKLSDEGSFKLHQLDSQLRTQIQLDPLGVGTLTNLAAKMADAAVTSGSWLNVRALYGDSQMFALPEKVENRLINFAREVPAGTSIQVLASGGDTTLSMRIVGKPLADMKLKFDSILEELAESEIDFVLEENTDENEVVLLLTKKFNTDEKVI
jgi:two-component sensor histidine kinase